MPPTPVSAAPVALVVGTVGYKGHPGQGRLEVGYGVVSSVRGRGLATEAVATLLTVSNEFEVVAETAVGNRVGQHGLEKLGFSRTGLYCDDRDGELITWARSAAPASSQDVRWPIRGPAVANRWIWCGSRR